VTTFERPELENTSTLDAAELGDTPLTRSSSKSGIVAPVSFSYGGGICELH
jgi:hypothetical protein